MQSTIGQELTFALPKSEYDSIPEAVTRKTKESLLRHVYGDTQVCLITSSNRSGKTKFADSITSSLNDDIRIIRLNTQDFYVEAGSFDDNQPVDTRQSDTTLSLIKHCIVDSAALDEKLVIIIDDADYLSPDVFDQLLNESLHDPNVALKTCFVFLGHPNLTGLLENISQTKEASYALLSLDNLSPDNLNEYIDYCQSPIFAEHRIHFEDDAIRIILAQSGGSLFKATVILEWSLLYARENSLTKLKSDDLELVVKQLSQRSKQDQHNYFLSYPTANSSFVEQPADNIDSTPNTLAQEKNQADTLGDIDLEETVVLPNPRPPLLETVVALRESDLLEPDKETQIQRKPAKRSTEPVKKTTTPLTVQNRNRKPVVKFILLGILIGAALLYFSQQNEPINIESVQSKNEVTEPSIVTAEDSQNELTFAEESQDVSAQPFIEDIDEQQSVVNQNPTLTTDEENEISRLLFELQPSEPIDTREKSDDASVNNTEVIESPPDIVVSNGSNGETSYTDPAINSSAASDAINRLLATAQHQFAQHKLTTPIQDSAYNTYQVILQIDPGNQRALEGIRQITERYKLWAKQALERKDIEGAKRYYSRALRINPDDYEVAVLLKSLER